VKKLMQNLYGLVALCTMYSYSLYYICMDALRVPASSDGLRLFSASLCFLSVFLYVTCGHLNKYDIKYIGILFIILSLTFFTRYIYGYTNSQYQGALLSFAVRAIPAAILALLICKKDNFDLIIKWCEPFVILYSIVTFVATFSIKSSSLIYQSISYYSMFAYGSNIFLISNRSNIESEKLTFLKGKIWLLLEVALLYIQIYTMLCGGGRGAFVLFVVFTIILLMLCKKNPRILFSLIINTMCLLPIAYLIFKNLIDSIYILHGLERITAFFSGGKTTIESDQRYHMYQVAWSLFKEQPLIGGGLGSVFYRLGSYSHNFAFDFLIETGIVGTLFISYTFIGFIKRLHFLLSISWKYGFILFTFVGSIIFLCFSSNFMLDGCTWFCIFFTFKMASSYKVRDFKYEKNCICVNRYI
jgi:hypothetical protein